MHRENDERNLILSVLAGVGIGAIVGAIAGILFAPRPGLETRERLGDSLQGIGTRLTDLTDEVATRVRSAVNAGRRAVEGDVPGAEEGGDRMTS